MKYLILTIACLIGNSVLAQDKKVCEGIVGIAIDAVNNSSTVELKKHLSSDFICAGQTGTTAIMTMELLVTQLNEHISDISKISEQQENGTLTLVYDFNYSKKLGHKNATFVFNTDNQLKQIDLLPVQVKKADTKTDFETPAQDILTVPMEIRNGLIVVTAKLNGIERKFILDSGAPTLYLNSPYFSKDTITSMSTAQSVNSSISGQDIIHIEASHLGKQLHHLHAEAESHTAKQCFEKSSRLSRHGNKKAEWNKDQDIAEKIGKNCECPKLLPVCEKPSDLSE